MALVLPAADRAPGGVRAIAVPEAIARDAGRRMFFELGVQAAQALGLDPMPDEGAELIALGEQLVLDYLAAPDAQGVWLWIVLARMAGRMDAGTADNDADRLAGQVIAFIEQEFKDDIAIDQALGELAALQMPVREEMARALLLKAGLDPERRVGMPKSGHPLHPWMAGAPGRRARTTSTATP